VAIAQAAARNGVLPIAQCRFSTPRASIQLGGAPANFAYMTSLLGDDAKIASCIGRDALGAEAIQTLKSLHLDISQLQEDALHPTGTVIVSLDSGGQPVYQITEGVAWDFLQRSDGWTNLARRADAVCFGSLAQRSAVSRETILDFLRHLRPEALRVFDVNLRQQFLRARYWIIQPDQPTS